MKEFNQKDLKVHKKQFILKRASNNGGVKTMFIS